MTDGMPPVWVLRLCPDERCSWGVATRLPTNLEIGDHVAATGLTLTGAAEQLRHQELMRIELAIEEHMMEHMHGRA